MDPEKLRSESSYWRSSLLITAAQLDLFGWLGKLERSPGAVVAHFGGNAQAWEMFLNALCAIGLLKKRAEKFSNTAFASPFYLGRAKQLFFCPIMTVGMLGAGLRSSLTTGKRPKTQKPFVSDRGKAERLLRGLHLHAQQIAPYLIEKLPLTGCRTLLDVGGGLGTFAAAFCRHYPRLRATLVRAPEYSSSGAPALRDSGMAKRVRVIGADFLRETLPAGIRYRIRLQCLTRPWGR